MKYPRIRNLREDHDYTQRFVAEYLNVNQNTYSDYETGKVGLSLDNIVKLADLYNVSVDYLLNRTKNKQLYR